MFKLTYNEDMNNYFGHEDRVYNFYENNPENVLAKYTQPKYDNIKKNINFKDGDCSDRLSELSTQNVREIKFNDICDVKTGETVSSSIKSEETPAYKGVTYANVEIDQIKDVIENASTDLNQFIEDTIFNCTTDIFENNPIS